MAWSKGPVDERIRLMRMWEEGEYTIGELAGKGGVSRQCFHKWLKRWRVERTAGMEELSRAPLNPKRTDPKKIEQLLALKEQHPDRGPEKLVAMMADRDGVLPMAVSTAGKILDRFGLVKHRRRRNRVGPPSAARVVEIPGAGHTLTADHKGFFRLGNGKYCYPLTIADPVSRYLYTIDAQPAPTIAAAWKVFDRIFREFGLPDQILTDNGTPFCSAKSLGGLTELSKRWIKLAIHVARIDAGRPQQNGRHERMHRTLKESATQPPRQNLAQQQQHFEDFRYDYNLLRPHKALGLRPPAERLTPFRRSYSGRIPDELPYPDHFELRRVRETGEIKVGGKRLFLSEVLAREVVAIDWIDDHCAYVYFGACRLGWVDLLNHRIVKGDLEPH